MDVERPKDIPESVWSGLSPAMRRSLGVISPGEKERRPYRPGSGPMPMWIARSETDPLPGAAVMANHV